jgi:hypothetical protein
MECAETRSLVVQSAMEWSPSQRHLVIGRLAPPTVSMDGPSKSMASLAGDRLRLRACGGRPEASQQSRWSASVPAFESAGRVTGHFCEITGRDDQWHQQHRRKCFDETDGRRLTQHPPVRLGQMTADPSGEDEAGPGDHRGRTEQQKACGISGISSRVAPRPEERMSIATRVIEVLAREGAKGPSGPPRHDRLRHELHTCALASKVKVEHEILTVPQPFGVPANALPPGLSKGH